MAKNIQISATIDMDDIELKDLDAHYIKSISSRVNSWNAMQKKCPDKNTWGEARKKAYTYHITTIKKLKQLLK